MAMTPSEHYRSQRLRICDLVRDLDDAQLKTRVPGCPEWTVRDLLSHLTGLAADLAADRTEDAGQPQWTAAQVSARAGWTVEQLLGEWDEFGPPVEAVLDGLGIEGYRTFYDAAMHEDDLREALGLPAATGETATEVLGGLSMLAGGRLAGLPPLQVRAGERSWDLNGPGPGAVLTVPDEGELARVLAGRRSPDQLRGLDWTGDLKPFIEPLAAYRPGT